VSHALANEKLAEEHQKHKGKQNGEEKKKKKKNTMFASCGFTHEPNGESQRANVGARRGRAGQRARAPACVGVVDLGGNLAAELGNGCDATKNY
jgi:hypothetical protein